MNKAWWEGFWRGLGLIWVKDCVMRAVCAIRGTSTHGSGRVLLSSIADSAVSRFRSRSELLKWLTDKEA